MEINLEEMTIAIKGNNEDIYALAKKISTKNISQVVELLNETNGGLPRAFRTRALKMVLNEFVKIAKELPITTELLHRLNWYTEYSDYQLNKLFNTLASTGDTRFHENACAEQYKISFWILVLVNAEVLNLTEETIINLTKLDDLHLQFNEFNDLLNGALYDFPGCIDVVEADEYSKMMFKSSTVAELRDVAAKYEINVPKRLNRAQLLEVIVQRLQEDDKFDEAVYEKIKDMKVVSLQRFAKDNDIKASTELRKDAVIDFILKAVENGQANLKTNESLNLIVLEEEKFEMKPEYTREIDPGYIYEINEDGEIVSKSDIDDLKEEIEKLRQQQEAERERLNQLRLEQEAAQNENDDSQTEDLYAERVRELEKQIEELNAKQSEDLSVDQEERLKQMFDDKIKEMLENQTETTVTTVVEEVLTEDEENENYESGQSLEEFVILAGEEQNQYPTENLSDEELREIYARKTELAEREAELEEAAAQREAELAQREAELEETAAQREAELAQKEAELAEKEAGLTQTEDEYDYYNESTLEEFVILSDEENDENQYPTENLTDEELREIYARKTELAERDAELAERDAELEEAAAQREAELAQREAELAEKEAELAEKEAELTQTEDEYDYNNESTLEEFIIISDEGNDENQYPTENLTDEELREIYARKTELAEKEAELAEKEAELAQKEAELAEQETYLEETTTVTETEEYYEENPYDDLSETTYVEEIVYQPETVYSENIVFQEEPMYSENIVYQEEPMYSENIVYQEAPMYSENIVYQEAPMYSENIVYQEVPMYSENIVYQDTPMYSENIVFQEVPVYSENVVYQEAPVYGDTVTQEVITMTEEPVYENNYAEYSDPTDYSGPSDYEEQLIVTDTSEYDEDPYQDLEPIETIVVNRDSVDEVSFVSYDDLNNFSRSIYERSIEEVVAEQQDLLEEERRKLDEEYLQVTENEISDDASDEELSDELQQQMIQQHQEYLEKVRLLEQQQMDLDKQREELVETETITETVTTVETVVESEEIVDRKTRFVLIEEKISALTSNDIPEVQEVVETTPSFDAEHLDNLFESNNVTEIQEREYIDDNAGEIVEETHIIDELEFNTQANELSYDQIDESLLSKKQLKAKKQIAKLEKEKAKVLKFRKTKDSTIVKQYKRKQMLNSIQLFLAIIALIMLYLFVIFGGVHAHNTGNVIFEAWTFNPTDPFIAANIKFIDFITFGSGDIVVSAFGTVYEAVANFINAIFGK